MPNITNRVHQALWILANTPLPQLAVLSASIAVASHITYFCHSERDLLAQPLFVITILGPIALQLLFNLYLGLPFQQCLGLTATIVWSFWVGMMGSIVVYRIWFHPLRNFPGPFWAKVTKWWVPWTQWRSGWKLHLVTAELHRVHGDVVRVGPNDLAINHPNALQVLAKSRKGTMYNAGYPHHSVQTTRSKKTHAYRRRVWDKAFTTKAVQEYLPRIMKYTNTLVSHISESGTTPIDVTEWFNFYMLDVMGDLAFGKPFNYLKPQERVGAYDFRGVMHESGYAAASLGQVSYIVHILRLLNLLGGFHKFQQFCAGLLVERMKETPENRDIFSYLLEAEPQNKAPYYIPLEGEARLIVIAASDTTTSTFIALFTLLASNPKQLQKLQAEIDAIYDSYNTDDEYPPKEIINGGTPATRHLEASISEALRINPVIANGVQRLVPDEGMLIDGVRIPGGVQAMYSFRVAQMDERWFPEPEEFRPERWYASDKETLAKQRSAFAPFWQGTYECAGKSLANMQLRVVTAILLRKFSVELESPDVNVKELLNDNSQDLFTTMMGSVKLVFRPRGV